MALRLGTTQGPSPLVGARGTLVSLLVIIAAATAAYWPSLDAPFLFDDYPAIVRNPSIRDLADFATALSPPQTSAGAAARPVVNLTLAIDYARGGLNPHPYHVTNLVLHAAVACLLWALTRRVLRRRVAETSASGASLLLTLVWALHPLVTESVACVIQRNEILVAGFMLATLYFLVRATDSAHPGRWQLGGVLAAWLAAASKEVAVVAPLLALLFDRTFLGGSFAAVWRTRWKFYLGLFASWLLIGALVATNHARAGTVGFGLGVTPWEYAVTQVHALAVYVKLTVWPHPLVVDYGLPTYSIVQIWPLALVLLIVLAWTIRELRRASPIGFLLAAFFLLLAPSSSFVPLTTQTIAEHRMYLPSAALVLTGAVMAARIGIPRLSLIAISLAVAGAITTAARTRTYQDEARLWKETIAAAPRNARALASLAGVYVRRERWDDAIAAYRRALALNRDYADAHNDLGFALTKVGRISEATEHYREAARLKPDDADIHYNLGNALLTCGDARSATAEFQRALELRPGFAAAENNLAQALLRQGDVAGAITHLENRARSAASESVAHRNLALELAQAGRLPEAIEQFRSVVALSPDSATAHNELGLAFAQNRDPDAASREFTEALRLDPNLVAAHVNLANVALARHDAAAAAVHLGNAARLLPDNASIRYNLGAVLAQVGRGEDARREFETALKLDPNLRAAREALQRLP